MRTVLGFKIYEAEQVADFLQTCLINLGVFFLYIVIAGIVLRLAGLLTDKLFSRLINASKDVEHKKHIATIKNLVKSIVNGVIVVIFVLSFLGRYNIDIRPLLTAAGVVGVAVGFAARRFVEDIIMGIFILLEGQVRVGDYVTIDNLSGTVEKVTLKMIIIRNSSGHVHYIRNGMIDKITNYSRDYAYAVMDITVAYKENIAKVMETIKELGNEFVKEEGIKNKVLGDIEIWGLDSFNDSSITIKYRIKTLTTEKFTIKREFNLRIKEKFDEVGIEIPFNQLDVNIKQKQ